MLYSIDNIILISCFILSAFRVEAWTQLLELIQKFDELYPQSKSRIRFYIGILILASILSVPLQLLWIYPNNVYWEYILYMPVTISYFYMISLHYIITDIVANRYNLLTNILESNMKDLFNARALRMAVLLQPLEDSDHSYVFGQLLDGK